MEINQNYEMARKKSLGGDSTIKHDKKNRLSREFLDEMEDVFISLSTTGELSGWAPTSSLPKVLIALGLDMNDLIRDLMNDKEFHLEYEVFLEVVCGCIDQTKSFLVPEMTEAYAIFDKSGVGQTTATDFRSALNKLGENVEIADMEDQLREFDTDRDVKMGINEVC